MRLEASNSWPTKRLRFLIARARATSSERQLNSDEEVTFLPMEAIGERGDLDLSMTRPLAEVQSGYSRFADGDVVVAKITPCFENGKGALIRHTRTGYGYGTTELHVLTPGPDLDGRFLYYATVQPAFRRLGEAAMTGAAGQQRVPEDFVLDFRIAVPTLSQQRAIADYLDRETARIDALIAAKERLLALLAEKRRALITRAVTRGLDPQAPLRDSGIPWLGEIPAHWKVKRIRFLTERPFRTSSHDASEVTFLPMEAIGENGELDLSILRPLSEVQNGYSRFRDGDVIIAKITPCFENGKGALIYGTRTGVGYGTTELLVLTPGPELIGRFLYYVTVEQRFRELGRAAMMGAAGQQRVPEEFVRDYQLAVPPITEQHAIVEHIARETAKLDAVRAATEHTIALLKERRSALIAAAVTGQIDVEDS